MKVRYKEDPRAWRKSTLLSLLGLALVSSLLRWRRVLPTPFWAAALAALALLAMVCWARPKLLRSYYRFSTWAGFWSSQLLVRAFLFILFVLIITPAGIFSRLLGKDLLRLKRPADATSYWISAKQNSPLDRQF